MILRLYDVCWCNMVFTFPFVTFYQWPQYDQLLALGSKAISSTAVTIAWAKFGPFSLWAA